MPILSKRALSHSFLEFAQAITSSSGQVGLSLPFSDAVRNLREPLLSELSVPCQEYCHSYMTTTVLEFWYSERTSIPERYEVWPGGCIRRLFTTTPIK